MPTYTYNCDNCGHTLDLFQKMTADPEKLCPVCQKETLKRKIGGGAGLIFKGSGFYITDYRSDSYRKQAESDSKPASCADCKKSDTCPAAAPAVSPAKS